jgi:hypothetical protein
MEEGLSIFAASIGYCSTLPLGRMSGEFAFRIAIAIVLAFLCIGGDGVFFLVADTQYFTKISWATLSPKMLAAMGAGFFLSFPYLVVSECSREIGNFFDSFCGLHIQVQYDPNSSVTESPLGVLFQRFCETLLIGSSFFFLPFAHLTQLIIAETVTAEHVLRISLSLFLSLMEIFLNIFAGFLPLLGLLLLFDFGLLVMGKFYSGLSLQGLQQIGKSFICFWYLFALCEALDSLESGGLFGLEEVFKSLFQLQQESVPHV